MKAKNNITEFIDSPAPEELKEILARWRRPELYGAQKKRKSEIALIDWLYEFIRLNVKRGRIFDLREVLKTGQADCLGYCKLFTVLGRSCGLDAGVVEVTLDNRGRSVPHTAILVRLSGGRRRFIDFWYGSKDIHHKRLGLRVKRSGIWRIEDSDAKFLKEADDFSYLPDRCVDGITLYIEGNAFLKNGDYPGAIDKYSLAGRLYPLNARIFYNRAIAYEKLDEQAKAKKDYARALRDEAAAERTLAAQPDDVVDLIQLDEHLVAEKAQRIFLLNKGFITGRKVSPAAIARKLALSLAEIESAIGSSEEVLAKKVE